MGRDDWNTFSPVQLAESLHPTGKLLPVKFMDVDPFSDIYGFKTRDGKLGLLQITAYTDNPAGVKIRYRLAQVDREQQP